MSPSSSSTSSAALPSQAEDTEANYRRLRKLLEYARDCLQSQLQAWWLQQYASPWADSPECGQKLLDALNGSGVLFGNQEKLLRSGQTHKFDLSLLALLLLHVGTPSATTKKHLHEIRSARNGTSHLANDRLDDKTFAAACPLR